MTKSMGDTKNKEVEARQSPLNSSANRNTNTNNNTFNGNGCSAETVVVQAAQVPVDVHYPQQQARVIVVHEHVAAASNPAVRNNSKLQCCYPITVEDPKVMVCARNIATTHVVIEVVQVFICLNGWCFIAFFLGVISSSVVACCSKHRAAYWVWSCIGGVLTVLHAISVAQALHNPNHYFHSKVYVVLQLLLCTVSALVAYYGCKTATAQGDRTLPHHHINQTVGQEGAPMQAPGHLVHGIQLS